MNNEDIQKVIDIIEIVNNANLNRPNSSSALAPSKGDCKRLRLIKAKFTVLSQDDIDNCFCGTDDRINFYTEFLIEWNKNDFMIK